MAFRHLQHTLDLAKLLFSQTSFWRELSLNISNHLPDSSFCIIGQPDLINSLIFADIYPGWDFQHACIDSVDIPQISSLFDQFALKFH